MKIRLSQLEDGSPEIIRTLQGEGSNTGKPTTFIRLQGCNLRCAWPCDTLYALDLQGGIEMEIADLVREVKRLGSPLCVTGGEPLLQERELLTFLSFLDWPARDVELETNGSMLVRNIRPYVRLMMDYKLPGSGMEEYMKLENFSYLRKGDDLIFVVADFKDYERAKQVIDEFHPQAEAFISPVWGKINLEALAERCIKDGLRMQVQTHKIIWGPTRRGV